MKKFLKILFYLFLGLLSLIVVLVLVYNLYFGILNSSAKSKLAEKSKLEVDGLSFRDLNNNGKLDVYEDSRQPVDVRVEDLLAQMTLEQKAGQMWHPPIGVGQNGEVLKKPGFKSMNPSSTYDVLIKKKIRHFNLFVVPKSRQLAEWYNEIQKIAEQDQLGIPVTISSDPRHGIINFMGSDFLDSDFSKWPEPIGLAAIGDSMLTVTFGRIANEEYRSVGIRTALHPMADLATEPRWARINGTFGENANLSAKITAAYIYGFQGDTLGPSSVACMTKHWPGGGPQADGEDAHFHYGSNQAYPGNNFKYHLIPFEAAFQAGTAMIMPYYGVAVGQTNEDVGMSFNKEIITGLLRKQYKYNGVVCTDWGIVEGFSFLGFEIVEAKNWGVQDLTVKERIKKVIDAGIDQFGGNVNIKELIELIKEGQISESRIDESIRRLLKAKFVMGLFDNPYVDPDMAEKTVGKKEFMEQGKLAQRRSIVLLKNKINPDSSMVLPLDHSVKIYVENINKSVAENYATVVDSLDDADFAILRLQTPWEPRHGDFVERFFHQGDLDFKEPERSRIQAILQEKPTVVCMYMDRPAVIPEIADASVGLLAEFGAYDDAVLDIIFGNFNPGAKLPFELPSSMEAVKAQYEDVSYDSKNPLFPFGHGLRYEVIK